jgi:renalase
MTLDFDPIHVAVIGSGMAGAACAAGLRSIGTQVTLFEKSATVGGRMATRQAAWTDGEGVEQSVTFDHGAHCFTRTRPRFSAVITRAMAAGCVNEWHPHVHTVWPVKAGRCIVATPTMPALCSHLLASSTVHLNRTVRRLQRAADGSWYLAIDGAPLAGPFHQVAMAMPPIQAALLLAGHQDVWADLLMARRMEPCWTLMAVTDDIDWPWDAAEPDRGPLSRVLRNDRLPGRTAPPGLAVWTAHATAEWSAAHLEDEPQAVNAELQLALRAQLPTINSDGAAIRWHHANVHRWRYAGPALDRNDGFDSNECWWDDSLGLGICGDFFGSGGVEAAWQSGDELADCMAASSEQIDGPDCYDDALNVPSRATSSSRLPAVAASAQGYQGSRRLVSPLCGVANHFSGAGLKVSHRIAFSNR